MGNGAERRKTRRDRRAKALPPLPPERTGAPAGRRRLRRPAAGDADLVAIENERLHGALREHIARLQEANRQLVLSNLNAQVMAEQLRAAKAEMTHLAHHDHLTALPNRVQFRQQLMDKIAEARARGGKLALLFIDLDRFKVVNDSLGHAVGDLLLQSVAQRLAASVRASDVVCRQGGDEFVAMLADVQHAEDVAARVESIHRLLTAPYTVAQHVLHIGASIGISIFPDDEAEAEGLMRNADIAMYSVKQRGRNCFAFFEAPMDARAVSRHQMEVDLRNALERQEFELYYQAQVDLASQRTRGAEALIRWRHPVDGFLLPKAFIGLAEECGMIRQIDRWVLREACQQACRWRDAGHPLDTISVNISAHEFECGDFVPSVLATLAQCGLAPHCLELELTESTMMRDSSTAIEKLAALRAAGVRIAIDDFGTGYSSLGYLRRLPIDTLKIDQSFVADIQAGTPDVLVDAVINIGNRLRYHVVAEGIETAEQLSFLQGHACGTGQGFHLALPMAAPEFGRALSGNA